MTHVPPEPASHGARSGTGARWTLRSATAAYHERVDAAFSQATLTDRDGYGRFLVAQAAAHLPVEEALTQAGAGMLLPDWPARQRADLIRADLASLGIGMPAPEPQPTFTSPAAVLGGVYVLEGSRLGGRLLRRSVPTDLPSSFLGDGDPAAWRSFLEVLDEHLASDADRSIAIKAAVDVFVLFEHSGHRFLKAH